MRTLAPEGTTDTLLKFVEHPVSLQTLEDFAKAPAPGFRCLAAGDGSGPRFLAKVRHVLAPPAAEESISKIQRALGDHAEQIAGFYRRHDGFILYGDHLSKTIGILLFPATIWDKATRDARASFGDLLDDPENDPDRIATGIAIATVPHSGNFFVMPVEGPSPDIS